MSSYILKDLFDEREKSENFNKNIIRNPSYGFLKIRDQG